MRKLLVLSYESYLPGITCPLRIFRLQKKAVMMTASVPSAAVYLTYLRMLPEAAEAACASSKHHE